MRYLLMVIAVAIFIICGCGAPGGEDRAADPEQPLLEPGVLPEAVEEWVESSRSQFTGRAFELEGLLYLLVTYGEKPTGGYTVEITDLAFGEDALVVTARFTEPGPGEMVTEALTYPYDLAVTEMVDLPVIFVAVGAETEIPGPGE